MSIPSSQVVSEKNNLCLEFEGNLGSNESIFMFTHYCNIPLKKDLYGRYDKSTYLDMQETMECPRIEIADRDNDGYKEIYLVQDWLCKEFAHPWGKDPKWLIFRVGADGKFVVVDRE